MTTLEFLREQCRARKLAYFDFDEFGSVSNAPVQRPQMYPNARQRGAQGIRAPCARKPHERARANLKTQKHERALAPVVMSALRHANLDSDITACEGDCSVREDRVHAGAEGNHSLQANIHLVRCVHRPGGAERGDRKLCCKCTHTWVIMMTIYFFFS